MSINWMESRTEEVGQFHCTKCDEIFFYGCDMPNESQPLYCPTCGLGANSARADGRTDGLTEWYVLDQKKNAAIARYFASNGEFGLYDAGELLKARAEVAAMLPPNAIAQAQTVIRAKQD